MENPFCRGRLALALKSPRPTLLQKMEPLAPLTAALGALAGGVANLWLFYPGQIIPQIFIGLLDEMTPTVNQVPHWGLPPAVGAMAACTCFHPNQLPFGGRMRAFLGGFAGSFVVYGFALALGWLFFAPLVAGASVYYYHGKLRPGEEPAVLSVQKTERATLFVRAYLLALAILGLLVFSQSLAVAGRGALFLIPFFLVMAGLYLAGAFLLLRLPHQDMPTLRRRSLVVGLAFHTLPLAIAVGYAFFVALPRVVRLDFVLMDPYTQTKVVDYSLAAVPILVVLVFIFMAGYLWSIRRPASL